MSTLLQQLGLKSCSLQAKTTTMTASRKVSTRSHLPTGSLSDPFQRRTNWSPSNWQLQELRLLPPKADDEGRNVVLQVGDWFDNGLTPTGSTLICPGGSLQLNNSLAGLRCTQLLATSDSAALPSVHMSPGEHFQERRWGRGEREGGGNCNRWRGFDQWSRSSRHRMVDRWVDQVTR